jgi:hypothetical protein
MQDLKEKKLLNAIDKIPFSGKISSHCSQIYFYYTGACSLVRYLTEVVKRNDKKTEHFFQDYRAQKRCAEHNEKHI